MGILSLFAKFPFGCGCCFVPLAPKSVPLPTLTELDVSQLASLTEGDHKVRFVCVSDTHGRHAEQPLPDGDVLVHSGDFSSFHGNCTAETIKEFDDWLGRQPHKHKIVVRHYC